MFLNTSSNSGPLSTIFGTVQQMYFMTVLGRQGVLVCRHTFQSLVLKSMRMLFLLCKYVAYNLWTCQKDWRFVIMW